jgi:hypothetical protein
MTDDFGVVDEQEVPGEEWPSDLSESDQSGILSNDLYKKLMKSIADDESDEEFSTSSDSSAELTFTAGEHEQWEENSEQDAVVNTEMAVESYGNAASAGEMDAKAEEFLVTDDEDVIAGDSVSAMTTIYPAMPEGLLDSAQSSDDEDAELMESQASWGRMPAEVLPEQIDPDHLFSGAAKIRNQRKSMEASMKLRPLHEWNS